MKEGLFMDRVACLLDIEKRSRILRSWYPDAKGRLDHARLLVQDRLDSPPTSGGDDALREARFLYASAAKSCEECSALLHELGGLVAVLLPSVWRELEVVGSPGRSWHERQGLDWQKADQELRHVESSALAAVAAERDGKRQSPPAAEFNSVTGHLFLRGRVFSLADGERQVLTVLVSKQAASLKQLKDAHERPDRVLRGLLKKYPALKKYISLPGGPGKGGYSTSIKLME